MEVLPQTPAAQNGFPKAAREVPETTQTECTLRILAAWRAELAQQGTRKARDDATLVDRAIETIRSLREETAGLRYALTARSTIDEAKGIIMVQHGCDEDEAFEILVRMSQDTNVPVRDVAGALVYKASGA